MSQNTVSFSNVSVSTVRFEILLLQGFAIAGILNSEGGSVFDEILELSPEVLVDCLNGVINGETKMVVQLRTN